MEKQWYSARTAYEVLVSPRIKGYHLYEDRIIVLQALSIDNAIEEAEKEAKIYAQKAGCKYLDFVTVFHLFENDIKHKTEVYSLMRDSKLSDDRYLDRFFDTGKERAKR